MQGRRPMRPRRGNGGALGHQLDVRHGVAPRCGHAGHVGGVCRPCVRESGRCEARRGRVRPSRGGSGSDREKRRLGWRVTKSGPGAAQVSESQQWAHCSRTGAIVWIYLHGVCVCRARPWVAACRGVGFRPRVGPRWGGFRGFARSGLVAGSLLMMRNVNHFHGDRPTQAGALHPEETSMPACSLFADPRRARPRVLAAARLALSLVAFTAASFA